MDSRLTLSNRPENLRLLKDFLKEWSSNRGLPTKRRDTLEQVAKEIFLNLVQAYRADQPGSIAITLEEKGARVRLMFEDDAPPYDPSFFSTPPGANDPSGRAGNLSRLRQATDSLVYYRTADRKNRLVVFLSL
jgi:anti-sigma regulatory factor (Ser/Thr protein kinase)